MALKKTEGGYEELTASIMHMDNCYATLDQERVFNLLVAIINLHLVKILANV